MSSQPHSAPRWSPATASACGSTLQDILSPTSPADEPEVQEETDQNFEDRQGKYCPPAERDEFNFWEPSTKATHITSPEACCPRMLEVTQDSEKERCSFWCGSVQDPAPECESILSHFMRTVAETPGRRGSSPSSDDDDHSPDMPPGVWTDNATTALLHGGVSLENPPGFWGAPDEVTAPRSCSPVQMALSGCKKQSSAISASKLFAKAVNGLAGQAAAKRVGNARRSSLGGA